MVDLSLPLRPINYKCITFQLIAMSLILFSILTPYWIVASQRTIISRGSGNVRYWGLWSITQSLTRSHFSTKDIACTIATRESAIAGMFRLLSRYYLAKCEAYTIHAFASSVLAVALCFTFIPQILGILLIIKRTKEVAMIPSICCLISLFFGTLSVSLYLYFMDMGFKQIMLYSRYPQPILSYSYYALIFGFFFLFMAFTACYAEGRAIRRETKYIEKLTNEKLRFKKRLAEMTAEERARGRLGA